jgi:hypothetical protein
MQRLEVSGAVRHIYITRRLNVNKGGWEQGTICGVARMLDDALSKGDVQATTGHEGPDGE